MECEPVFVVLPTARFPFHAVYRRRPQSLQKMLILTSAIAKSPFFRFPRILADSNNRFLVKQMEEYDPTLYAASEWNPSTR